MSAPIEIKIDNKQIESKLLDLAKRSENLRPLMKNIAGIFAYSTEENFKEEGRPKWENLKDSTIKQRTKKKQWPGMILQVTGQLADAGKNKSTHIEARPYLKLTDDEFDEILDVTKSYLK